MGNRREEIEGFLRANKGPILFLVLLIAAIGAVAGYQYYRYTQEDPTFCYSCHLMQEAVKSWQISAHKQYACQRCHTMTIFEQNKLLVAFVVNPNGKIKQRHGKAVTWEVCKDCHMYDVAQGSVTLRNSYGHAKHVFMQEISCDKCHQGELHSFTVSRERCIACHTGKVIHGMGMQGLACLNCHSYSEATPKMIDTNKCIGCHKEIPRNFPMGGIKCFECHKPHGKLKLESKDCLGTCHGNENNVGQHGLHRATAKLDCLDCHRPHTWIVGKKQAKGLCDRCHKMRDPASFVY